MLSSVVRREWSWDSRVVILVRRFVRWGLSAEVDGGAGDDDCCCCCRSCWFMVAFFARLAFDDCRSDDGDDLVISAGTVDVIVPGAGFSRV